MAVRPLCELLMTPLEISCPPDPAVLSEQSPACPAQTQTGTSEPASWASQVALPSARTVRRILGHYGAYLTELMTDQTPRAHLGSGGWRQVWLAWLTGGIEAQSDRKVNNRCMVTTFVTWCRISGLERCFSSELLMISRMENRKMKTSRTAIWWADILRMV